MGIKMAKHANQKKGHFGQIIKMPSAWNIVRKKQGICRRFLKWLGWAEEIKVRALHLLHPPQCFPPLLLWWFSPFARPPLCLKPLNQPFPRSHISEDERLASNLSLCEYCQTQALSLSASCRTSSHLQFNLPWQGCFLIFVCAMCHVRMTCSRSDILHSPTSGHIVCYLAECVQKLPVKCVFVPQRQTSFSLVPAQWRSKVYYKTQFHYLLFI